MASGCEFICSSKDCKNNNTGFVITAPWPLGDIDLVIKSQSNTKNEELRQYLDKIKEEGRKYACINFPNNDNIPYVGYRVQLWCEKCYGIQNYDAIIQDEKDTMEETIKKANVPEECFRCNFKLSTFAKILEDGIKCLSCGIETKKHTWFSNEKSV